MSTEQRTQGRGRRTKLAGAGLKIALIFAVAVITIVWKLEASGIKKPVDKAEVKAKPSSAFFMPTEAQWKNLAVEPVRLITFRTERVAEGRIAINDYKTTPVFSPYSGRVTRIFAEAGAVLQQGAPLYLIEATEFVQAQNDLTVSINGLNKAEAAYRLAKINVDRQQKLYAVQAVAKRDWEQAQSDFTAAENDLSSAKVAIEAVKNRLRILGKSAAEIDQIVAGSARINPEVAVRAPISGTLVSRKLGLGQYIQAAASDPVFTLGDLSTVWVVANVRESDAPYVHVGQTVEVKVLALPDKPVTAKIVYVAPSLDPNTHRLIARAEIDNADGSLKPEMFANIIIVAGETATAPAVPQTAIVYEGPSTRVWVVDKDRRIQSRTIAVGRASQGMVEVLRGLAAGESVVTSGALFIDRAANAETSSLELDRTNQ